MLDLATTRPAALTREAAEDLSRQRQEPEWLRRLRLRAFDAFEQAPLPTTRTEGWRRTNLAGLDLNTPRLLPDGTAHGVARPEEARAYCFVQQDGATVQAQLSEDLARRGVRVLDLAAAVRDPRLAERIQAVFGTIVPPESDKFTALQYAFLNAGVVVHVPRNVVLTEPLELVQRFTQPGLAAFTHTLVLVDEGAQVSLHETYASDPREGAPLASGVVEFEIGPNAHAGYVQVQRWAEDTFSFNWQRACLDVDASFRTLNVALGSRLARTTVQVLLEGDRSQADLLGVVAGRGRQHLDFQTLQDHVGSATRSDLVIHNALRGASSSNFTGTIRINKQSRQTESSQEQQNILLSPKARAESDPKLEILNNDVVRCTHGAAVGPLDPEIVFYLQSRGLDQSDAQELVLEGFFRSVLNRMGAGHEDELVGVWGAIKDKLAHGGDGLA